MLLSRVAVAPLSTTVTVNLGWRVSNELIRSVIALFDGGTPKKFDAPPRFIIASCSGSFQALAKAAKEEHIKIDALTVRRCCPLDSLSAPDRYFILLPEPDKGMCDGGRRFEFSGNYVIGAFSRNIPLDIAECVKVSHASVRVW